MTTTIADPSSDDVLKDAYAMLLLQAPNDPFGCALKLFGTNTVRALEVSQTWVCDYYVLSKQADLLAEFGEDHFLPSKAIAARRVFEMAEMSNADRKDRLAAYRLYAEMRGFIEKGGGININNNITTNRVMVVKDHGSNDDWERSAAGQQSKLIEHSRD